MSTRNLEFPVMVVFFVLECGNANLAAESAALNRRSRLRKAAEAQQFGGA